MSKYLDNTGLSYFWQKIKNTFVKQEAGKQLSSNDFTDEEKQKLAGLSNDIIITADDGITKYKLGVDDENIFYLEEV